MMEDQQYLAEIKGAMHLPSAALAFAQVLAYPDLDVQQYLDRINLLHHAAAAVIPGHLSDKEKAIALARYLFGPGGIRGNSAKYYDPRNSFLNEVLDRKLGLPISMSVILIDVGRQFGLHFRGIGLPGHFIVSAMIDGETLYFDPFHNGNLLSEADCREIARKIGGMNMEFNPEWLRPVSHLDILIRMLNNLRNVYMREKQWEMVLKTLKLLQVTEPNEPGHIRDIGLLHFKMGNRRCAIYYLESYVLRKIRSSDSSPIRALLAELVHSEAMNN